MYVYGGTELCSFFLSMYLVTFWPLNVSDSLVTATTESLENCHGCAMRSITSSVNIFDRRVTKRKIIAHLSNYV